MTPIVEIAVARLTRSKAIDDEDARRRRRRLQWLSTEKKNAINHLEFENRPRPKGQTRQR